jgi:hypothetical protein
MLGGRFIWTTVFAALSLFWPALADAQSSKETPVNAAWSAGFMISTLGPGLQISYRVYDWAVVRVEGSYVSVPTDGLTLSLQSAGAMLDLHPFKTGFRVSGGLRYFEYDIHGIVTVNEGGDGGASTPNRFRVEATNSNKAAPYAGLGFDTSHFSGGAYELRLGLDFGVIYSGKPSASVANLDNPGEDVQTQLTKIIDKYQFLDFYPVATVSARLTF